MLSHPAWAGDATVVSPSLTVAGDVCHMGLKTLLTVPFNSSFTQEFAFLLFWINASQYMMSLLVLFLLLIYFKIYHADIDSIKDVFSLQVITQEKTDVKTALGRK